uniref:Uncharacterized protein n=1 Tax=Anguilla anguilla TaxID=7936 RepID=A0A0E9QA80_ANGAN
MSQAYFIIVFFHIGCLLARYNNIVMQSGVNSNVLHRYTDDVVYS